MVIRLSFHVGDIPGLGQDGMHQRMLLTTSQNFVSCCPFESTLSCGQCIACCFTMGVITRVLVTQQVQHVCANEEA